MKLSTKYNASILQFTLEQTGRLSEPYTCIYLELSSIFTELLRNVFEWPLKFQEEAQTNLRSTQLKSEILRTALLMIQWVDGFVP